MDDLYWRYGAKPVTVNAKMQYRPAMNSIVYVEGMRSVKVERWQIEYYADVLSGYLNVAEEREGGYYELICKLLEQPQFWVFFSEEERTEMLDKMINDEEFARNIERRYGEEDKPAMRSVLAYAALSLKLWVVTRARPIVSVGLVAR